jgi:hypothetical protein
MPHPRKRLAVFSFALRFAQATIVAGCCLSASVCLCQDAPTAPPSTQTPAPSTQTPAALPDVPAAQTPRPAAPLDEVQSKRIMGVLPNFRSVSAGANVPPETPRERFIAATEDNYDYTSLFFAGWIAADAFATKATPEFHQGAAGFGRYYWHTVADQSVENYFVEFIIPTMTHEDSRYFAIGKEGGGPMKRLEYSVSRVVVARTESGKATFNISEIAGSAAAASVSNFYYPTREQNVHTTLRNWGLDVSYDAANFTFHEFWPDIRNLLFGHFQKKTITAP